MPANPATPQDLEAKKAQLISRQLHLRIQQHSSKLLDFIDIEACNEDDGKLSALNNNVSSIAKQCFDVISDVFQWEPFSMRRVLEDASTSAIETALLGLFEDKEKQIETAVANNF